ncbi:MAG: DNA polymerase III subunit beta [Thermoguttaceae bacterium]|nr:DNA polymerase III subunit beta [Thermoguttaceae bacterium]
MKITCNSEKFAAKFNLAAAYVASRDVKTVLQDVKMDVKTDHVIFSATDNETSIRIVLRDVEIGSEGAVMIPSRLMKSILQTAKAENIDFELDGDILDIRVGTAFYEIPTPDANDFPEISLFTGEAYHEVLGADLLKNISRTTFATDMENNKYALSGVLFELTDGSIDTVSTDGRRLTHQRGKAVSHGGHQTESGAIVPLKALNAVEKAIGEVGSETAIKIAVEGGKITFVTANDEIMITSRLVDGRFPAWRKIIPEKTDRVKADVPLNDFQLAVQQMKIMTTESQPGLLLNFKPGQLIISASGNGKSSKPVVIAYDQNEIQTKLDPNFLVDFLRCFSGVTNLSIYLKENSSVLFESQQDDDYAYILMPLA